VLTLPLFFLVLPGLVKRFLCDPLVCALRVPIWLPHIVCISSVCDFVVVRRSSRSLHGFNVSLPVAWSPPTLIRNKVTYLLLFSKFTLLSCYFYVQPSYLSTYCREDRATLVLNITRYLPLGIEGEMFGNYRLFLLVVMKGWFNYV
jgi:hypothetical protein